MSPWAIKRLSKAIEQGGVIAYPTDTIWGFGCHPMRFSGVAQILAIKQRSVDKGLILLSSNLDYCEAYIDPGLSKQQIEQIRQEAERPITWLLPAGPRCPVWIRGAFPTLALRITSHPLVKSICDQLESPLVSTSANRAQRSPVRNAIQARRQFGAEVDHIVTGFVTGTNRASEIKSLASGDTIRT